MRADVERDLIEARDSFQRLVWPRVAPWCGNGRLITVETATSDELRELLDMYAGIDAFQLVPVKSAVRAIAYRVQKGSPFESFTVREKRRSGADTELQKRLTAIDDQRHRWLLPDVTIQGYVNNARTRLLYVVVACTDQLYRFVGNHLHELERRTNSEDGTLFRVVWCEQLRAAGVKLKDWSCDGVRLVKSRGHRWSG